jgi:hypothetical protein
MKKTMALMLAMMALAAPWASAEEAGSPRAARITFFVH